MYVFGDVNVRFRPGVVRIRDVADELNGYENVLNLRGDHGVGDDEDFGSFVADPPKTRGLAAAVIDDDLHSVRLCALPRYRDVRSHY